MIEHHDEDRLLDRLVHTVRNDSEPVTLLIGSGVTSPAVPRVSGLLDLADRYASSRAEEDHLRHALAQARRELGPDATATDLYIAYRRVFADWVSGGEFDVVAQQGVLRAYRPADWSSSPLATHGIWQRVDLRLGEAVENDRRCWQLPTGVESIGRLLAHQPDAFGNRILTTNFDPLLEIAVRRAHERATSVAVAADGSTIHWSAEAAVRVLHLHGFWRPTGERDSSRLLHDPGRLVDPDEDLVRRIASLINTDIVCVVGYGGWDRAVTAALRVCVAQRQLRVWWAMHGSCDDDTREALTEALGAVECFARVDSDRLFPRLADTLRVPRTETNGERRRVRHHAWERELLSQPHSIPPENTLALLDQLERRFGWGRGGPSSVESPRMLVWPIRVRPRASLIHAVQALAAGALAARGVRLEVFLDDYGIPDRRQVDKVFQDDLRRWIRLIESAAEPHFTSLYEFNELSKRPPSGRATDPWTVGRLLYGEHNPSVYSVLVAIKVVPNVPLRDLEENAFAIVNALLSHNANRLLTPMIVWPAVHDLLGEESIGGVLTLGGRDESLFWELWRQRFGVSGVRQLYNPHIKTLSNESGMVRWSSEEELRDQLERARQLDGWDNEGSYIPWLFQNALLLPNYLTKKSLPQLDGQVLDSWASFHAAVESGPAALDVLAERVSDLYLRRETT